MMGWIWNENEGNSFFAVIPVMVLNLNLL